MKCQATGKVIHRTHNHAVAAALRLSKVVMNVYPCKACGGYHVGHSNNPVRLANRITELLENSEQERARRAAEKVPVPR